MRFLPKQVLGHRCVMALLLLISMAATVPAAVINVAVGVAVYRPQYPIVTSVIPADAGFIEGPGQAPKGPVELRAVARPGYVFAFWNLSDGTSPTENPVVATQNGVLRAQATFVPGVTAGIEGDGLVEGDWVPSVPGQVTTFVARPGVDADFSGWYANGLLWSSEPALEVVGDGRSRHFVARFVMKPIYRTEVTLEPLCAGRLQTGSPLLDFYAFRDRPIRLTATPWPGFVWRGWEANGEWLGGEPSVDYPLQGDVSWTGHFEPDGALAVLSFNSNAVLRLTVPAGTNVVLATDRSAEGWAAPGLRWYRGRRLLSAGSRSVVLTNVKPSDTGVYRFCLVVSGNRKVWTAPVRLKVVKPRPASTAGSR